ncbi:MAG TPA: hypothetical protein VNR70_13170 [Steroidobacteraceae bacterium]|jgi:hypothetical protein|nr:hypothetical protein [Steroidobacteraceae bacterium]
MSTDESSDYTRWVTLANDPNQSEEARRRYREQMEAHVHRKVREAFKFAAKQTPPSSTDSSQKPVEFADSRLRRR